MSREKKFSDEFLNAFVDDQLETEEKGRAYLEIGQDEELNRRVCELRKLRELVRLSYENPPLPENGLSETVTTTRRVRFNIAAGLTLILGVMLGWLLHSSSGFYTDALAPPSQETGVSQAAPDTITVKASKTPARRPAETKLATAAPLSKPAVAPTGEQMKVLFHVSRSGKVYLKDALDEIEELLKFYNATGQRARVEVVINSDGLELVRADTSAFSKRILQLQEKYNNLTFAACRNTIDRLKRERGITAKLLPGVVVIDSGMAQIMRRQHQGWAYIEV